MKPEEQEKEAIIKYIMSKTQLINVSFWGKWPEWDRAFPNDFLWHDRIEKLPQIGDVIEIMGIIFQIEGIEPNLQEKTPLSSIYVLLMEPNYLFFNLEMITQSEQRLLGL